MPNVPVIARAFENMTPLAAAAITTAALLLKELCDASSTITDTVCKQVLGENGRFWAAVMRRDACEAQATSWPPC